MDRILFQRYYHQLLDRTKQCSINLSDFFLETVLFEFFIHGPENWWADFWCLGHQYEKNILLLPDHHFIGNWMFHRLYLFRV